MAGTVVRNRNRIRRPWAVIRTERRRWGLGLILNLDLILTLLPPVSCDRNRCPEPEPYPSAVIRIRRCRIAGPHRTGCIKRHSIARTSSNCSRTASVASRSIVPAASNNRRCTSTSRAEP